MLQAPGQMDQPVLVELFDIDIRQVGRQIGQAGNTELVLVPAGHDGGQELQSVERIAGEVMEIIQVDFGQGLAQFGAVGL